MGYSVQAHLSQSDSMHFTCLLPKQVCKVQDPLVDRILLLWLLRQRLLLHWQLQEVSPTSPPPGAAVACI